MPPAYSRRRPGTGRSRSPVGAEMPVCSTATAFGGNFSARAGRMISAMRAGYSIADLAPSDLGERSARFRSKHVTSLRASAFRYPTSGSGSALSTASVDSVLGATFKDIASRARTIRMGARHDIAHPRSYLPVRTRSRSVVLGWLSANFFVTN